MELTAKETKIIEVLRKDSVATIESLGERVGVSDVTVMRALKKYGHYSSYNFNSIYQVLEDTPEFDGDGLWFHRQIGFSNHGTLKETIQVLIEDSRQGYMVQELEGRLKTRVHNQLSMLCRSGQIRRFCLGRKAVYVSADIQKANRQQAARTAKIGTDRDRVGRGTGPLPEGMDALTVIRLLAEMVQRPEASVASLSQTLQRRGVGIDAEQVREVIAFYGLQKKTAR
jgi:hypothetical protein